LDTETLRPRELVEAVDNLRNGKRSIRPFHWEIEFPEVFNESEDRKSVGFDAVVGNPPYIQLQKNKGELAKIYDSK